MERTHERLDIDSGTRFLGVTFLYMFIALLVSAASAFATGYIFTKLLPYNEGENALIYYGTLITSLVLMFIAGLWFNISAYRGKHSLAVPFAIYAVLFGIFASSFTMFIDIEVIGIALFITCLTFGVMALISMTTKRNMNFLLVVVFGILIGASIIALTNLIWILLFPETFYPIYWLVQFAMFGVVMLITLVDSYNVRKTAEQGYANKNLALYCAFSLYVDFINIFFRILYFILIAFKRDN